MNVVMLPTNTRSIIIIRLMLRPVVRKPNSTVDTSSIHTRTPQLAEQWLGLSKGFLLEWGSPFIITVVLVARVAPNSTIFSQIVTK